MGKIIKHALISLGVILGLEIVFYLAMIPVERSMCSTALKDCFLSFYMALFIILGVVYLPLVILTFLILEYRMYKKQLGPTNRLVKILDRLILLILAIIIFFAIIVILAGGIENALKYMSYPRVWPPQNN